MTGSSQGTTTSTGTQIPWDSGNLQEIHNSAVDMMRNHGSTYYPGQSYAGPNNYQIQGLNNAAGTGFNLGEIAGGATGAMQGAALNANTALAGGEGVTAAMPWLNALTTAGSAGNPAQSAMDALFGVATGSAAQNLDYTASGGFLNNNPWLDKQFQSASDPVVRAFQTATSPRTDSTMNAAGRLGSGAWNNAQSTNEKNLGNALTDLSSNLYGTDYANERNRMVTAANQLGNLQNSAYGAAGQLGVQGQGVQNAANTGALDAWSRLLSGQQQAINSSVPLSDLWAKDYQNGIASGDKLQGFDQAAISDQMARYYGNQNAPWEGINKAAAVFGNPMVGFSSQTTPYFKPSPLAQIGSMASSGAGIASALGGK